MEIWHVARELGGVAEAGGVKDVVRGLADAAAEAGWRVAVVVPQYGFMPDQRAPVLHEVSVRSCDHDAPWRRRRERAVIRETRLGAVRVLLVDSERYRDKRSVYTYTEEDQLENEHKAIGTGHWDAHQMNLLLQRAALAAASRAADPPDLFHCHDGHAAFLPALLRRGPRRLRRTAALLTVHNAGDGYRQEVYGLRYAARLTGLPARLLRELRLGDAVEPILASGRFAVVNSVSEGYAMEIGRTPLGAALAAGGGTILGLENGIDTAAYDPRDPACSGLPFSFDPGRGELDGKRACRRHLLQSLAKGRCGRTVAFGSLRPSTGSPLVVHVGRLAAQKGSDRLAEGLGSLLARDADVVAVVLGRGERRYEQPLERLAAAGPFSGRMVFLRGFDTLLAQLLYAAGDLIAIPSEYEPCGLSDLYGQMMACLPVVRLVGGLIKVEDGVTGFGYRGPGGLAECLSRALTVLRGTPATFDRMRRMAFDRVLTRYSWTRVFQDRYGPLYRRLIAQARGR